MKQTSFGVTARILARFGTLITVVLTLSAGASSPQMQTPAVSLYSAQYKARFNGIPLTMHRELSQQAEGYQLRVAADNLLGTIEEREDFSLREDGSIAIESYTSKRVMLGKTRSEQLQISADRGQAVYTRKKKKRELAMQAEYLGPLSYQLQLRRDLQNDKAELSYPVLNRGRVKDYRFRRLGEETVDTALGKIKAVKLERVRDNQDRQTELWLAPQWDYLLIKLVQHEKGERYQTTLRSASIDGQAVSLE